MKSGNSGSSSDLCLPVGLTLVGLCVGLGLRSASPVVEPTELPDPPTKAAVVSEGEIYHGENYTTPASPGHALMIHGDQGVRPTEGPSTPYPVALLAEAEEVNAGIMSKRMQVVDVRPWKLYADRHIPGAVHVELHDWLAAFTARQAAVVGQQKIGSLGLDPNVPIVVCDDGFAIDGTCAWWMLRYWGCKDVRLLQGGWPSWLFLGARQETDLPRTTARAVAVQATPGLVTSVNDMRHLVSTGRGQLAQGRFPTLGGGQGGSFGQAPATAGELNWLDVFDATQSRIASAESLGRQIASARISLSRPTIVYGETLQATTPIAFVLQLMGAKNVSVSWPGWDKM